MIKGYRESSLSTSQIFNDMSKMSGSNQIEKATNIIRNSKHLSKEDIESYYIQIKQYPSSLAQAAMMCFEEGKIVLVYNNTPSISVSQSLPFITFKTKGEYKTYLFMDRYVKEPKDGVFTTQTPILHDLLVSAFVANRLKNNYQGLTGNQFLERLLMDIYTKFMLRILSKDYLIAADKIPNDTIWYWINKFFLIHVFGSIESSENIEILSTKHFKYIDEMKANEIKNQYDEANPSNIEELLELVKSATSKMEKLSLGGFISSWINFYFLPSMLAIDNIEYLIFMIISLLNSNNIINISASDIVKEMKGIKNLNAELIKLA